MNNRFKLLTAISFAAALSVSFNANAAATVVKNFGNVGTNPFGDFGNTFYSSGSFLDDYTFSFTSGSSFSSFTSAKVFKVSSGSDTKSGTPSGISDFTAFLIGPDSLKQSFSVASDVGAKYKELELDLDYLKPGNYKIETSGTVTNRGSYAGTFEVSAVPEPKTYGMLLLGIGLMVVATRRKSNSI